MSRWLIKLSNRKFNFLLRFFYDLYAPVLFEFSCIFTIYASVCTCFTYTIVDVMFLIFGTCLVEHLKFIQENIRRMDKNSKNINEIIDLHVESREYFKRLNDIYVPQLVIKFFSVAIFVCLCGYQITEVIFQWNFKQKFIWFVLKSSNLNAKTNSVTMLTGILFTFMIYTATGTQITTTVRKMSIQKFTKLPIFS